MLFVILVSCRLPLTAQDNDKEFYVFIGEKIDVAEFNPESNVDDSTVLVIMDYAFKARYTVIDWVYNSIPVDTVEFEAYDHYGKPAFASYSHVLLYLVKEEGKLYHSKYQFNDLYQTTDGRWASPWWPNDYGHVYNKETTIKPEKIDFAEQVIIDVSKLDHEQITLMYPEPYYKREGDNVVAIYGNFIHELFQLKKDGVFKARGTFN